MSLLDEFYSTCVFMNKSKVSDGEGGFTTAWTEGASFDCAIVLENSTLAIVADSQQMSRTYKVTINNNMVLEKGDVIKRVSDGAIFKIDSDSTDVTAPDRARMQISQVTAHRWELT